MAYKPQAECKLDLAAALHGVAFTDDDLRLLDWLSGWGAEVTDRLTDLIERARIVGVTYDSEA